MRQNRDIAKINSDQSQKIRRLENDCARLLSENLELRARILRLEKQVQDNNAQRIADHALEIKAKLEAQLSDFASLLCGLGTEPPSKRHSPDSRRIANPRQSMIRSPPQRKRRETAAEAEALAEQEGRLPPIYENKTYPRATMNSEEILALCAAAADSTESPDLGPPPVSRFVEEVPVTHNSPTGPTRTAGEEIIPESPRRPSPPTLDYDRRPPSSPGRSQESEEATTNDMSPARLSSPAKQLGPRMTQQTIRAGSKRKFGDENEFVQIAMAEKGKENADGTDEATSGRGNQKRRSIKELPAGQRERAGRVRMPLAVKSTNEDVSSPRKAMKVTKPELGKEEQSKVEDSHVKERTITQRALQKIEIPPPEPPAATTVMLDSEAAPPSATPSSPATPNRQARQDVQHDTPPPAHISSNGETSRPSRRARAAISYAEPNLRDKMRRPTKELFDAVAGEGKFVHRSIAPTKSSEQRPTSVSKARPEPGTSTGSISRSFSPSETTPKVDPLSPLAQKEVFRDTLPNTVVTERRKRPSAAGISSREPLSVSEGVHAQPSPSPTITADASGEVVVQPSSSSSSKHGRGGTPATELQPPAAVSAEPAIADIYDFANSSIASDTTTTSSSASTTDPSDASKPAITAADSNGIPPSRSRTARKSSMAAAAALREMLDEQDQDEHRLPAKPRASSSSRKRASMLAPKKTAMLLDAMTAGAGGAEGQVDDEGADPGGGSSSARDRVSRRRSMML